MARGRRGRDARRTAFDGNGGGEAAGRASAAAPGRPTGAPPDAPQDVTTGVIDEITWYMREHKVSRADLAGAMGVSPGRVSRILSGGESLTPRTLGTVLAALGARLEITLRPADEPASASA